MNSFAFIVPVYKHGSTLDSVVSSLVKFNCPIIVVDDGNSGDDRNFIERVAEKHSQVILVRHEKNGGKGRAVNDGVRKAYEIGATHVLQIDSDGQHDVNHAAHFLELSEKNPRAVICGYPEYDESVPSGRLKARKIANTWVHIVTLSGKIKDTLIGFRIYPVEPYHSLLRHHALMDSHMGFDIDILVRLIWKNVPVIQSPVRVIYPENGISNFRVVKDNIHISLTYSRLCIGMILRLPLILVGRLLGKGGIKDEQAVV